MNHQIKKPRGYSAFFCETALQLINSIAVTLQGNLVSDIYISNILPGIEKIAPRLKKTKVFKRVIILDNKEVWHRYPSKYLSVFIGYFRIKPWIESSIPRIKEYSDVFIANTEILNRFVYIYIEQYFPSSRIHFIEEGVGSYDQDCFKLTKMDSLMRRLQYGVGFNNDNYDVYLHAPKLFSGDRNRVRKIEREIKGLKDICRHVFDIDTDQFSNKKYIIFDSVYSELNMNDSCDEYKRIITEIIKRADDVVIKPHPRDGVMRYDCDYYINSHIPFDCLCLLFDFSDKILITFNSSAVFSPKLFSDCEPKIVFLLALLEDKLVDDLSGFVSLCNNFREMYNNNNLVIFPKTEDELFSALNTVLS